MQRSGPFYVEALLIHDWLKEAEAADDVRWYSLDEQDSGSPGLHMPI